MAHRVVLILLLLILFAPQRSYAQSAPHVRFLDPVLKELFDEGMQQSPRRQIALLAHELQHALEIGERTDILDAEGMESLYEEIGFQSSGSGSHKSYETEAAMAIQRAVDDELGRAGRGANAY